MPFALTGSSLLARGSRETPLYPTASPREKSTLTDLRHPSLEHPITRRALLRYGGSLGAAVTAMSGGGALWRAASAAGAVIRQPDSLPNPKVPAGTVNEAMPFDHIVIVMMENHSFDNLLGALARSGQPRARGLRFNHAGVARNSNPGAN